MLKLVIVNVIFNTNSFQYLYYMYLKMKRKLIYLLLLCVSVAICLFIVDFERNKFWTPIIQQVDFAEFQEFKISDCSMCQKNSSAVAVKLTVTSDSVYESLGKTQNPHANRQNQLLYESKKIESEKPERTTTEEIIEVTTSSSIQPVTEESYQQKLLHFKRRLSIEQKEKMLDLFRVFIRQMELHNLTYMAYGGTLIGINRHHGIIPWDDDIDILIDAKQKRRVEKAMRKLRKTHKFYIVDESLHIKWKFFNVNGLYTEGFDFKYPYIDVFSMLKVSDNEVVVEGEDESNMNLEHIYPLVKRPFNGLAVYSPCNVRKILKSTYTDFNKCSSPYYSHEFEDYLRGNMIEVDCQMLKERYPFVEKSFKVDKNKIILIEKLIRNGTVLQIAKYSMPDSCTNERSFYDSDLEVTILNY